MALLPHAVEAAIRAWASICPDEWIRRLGKLPLVYQPGERWMYHTAANVTGVLIARATGMSFGDALRERICEGSFRAPARVL